MAAATPRVRQRFNVVIGWSGVVLGLVLAVGGVMSAGRGYSMVLIGSGLSLLSYCVLVRPHLRFGASDVLIANVVRDVTIPWEGISHATSRGSLVIHDNDGHRTTAWAIGAQKARRDDDAVSDDLGASIDAGRRGFRPMPGTLVQAPTSAAALREGINAETVDNPPDAPAHRQVHFVPISCILMILAVVCIAWGFAL